MTEATGTAHVVEHEIRIDAPPETVFPLLTERDEIARWMQANVLEPRVGGRVEIAPSGYAVTGTVTRLEPPRVVAYTWDWVEQPLGGRTEVTFEVLVDGAGSLVRLRHEGLRTQEAADQHAQGWVMFARRLAEVAAGRDPGPEPVTDPGA